MITDAFTLFVLGHPATQGSKKGFARGRKVVMVEMDPKLPAWRKATTEAVLTQLGPDWIPLDGALKATVTFYLPRPKASSFGEFPAGPPDLDKLQRAIGDALTQAKAIHDDARIVRWVAEKSWDGQGMPTGAQVTVVPFSYI